MTLRPTLRPTLTVLFGVSVAVANVTAAKLAGFTLPVLGQVAVPAGFVAFGVAFLCSDLLVEYHGREYASRVVSGTVLALVVAYGLIWVAIALPPAPFFEASEAYATTLGSGSAVVIASVLTILVSQQLDVRLFDYLRAATGGDHRWLRNCGSTAVSQAVDTLLFITLAFAVVPAIQGGDALWGRALVLTIVGQYVVKLVVAALDTPVFYLVTSLVPADEGTATPDAVAREAAENGD